MINYPMNLAKLLLIWKNKLQNLKKIWKKNPTKDYSNDLNRWLISSNLFFFFNMTNDDYFMGEAIIEAQKSLDEGGLPIGAVIVKDEEIISRGHNRLIQKSSVVLHAEMDAIENAGRLNYEDYTKCTIYTTLSPCPMCSGAIILYNIPKVVIGENTTLMGAENFLQDNDVEVVVLNNLKCKDLFLKFVEDNPGVWEDELKKVGNTTEVK